ncbi:MAG: hypothetical protein EXR31_10455 [Betaproteobacteria bacterium]|nr:hypothetical protein [Betaproteobacteria bacterium]
MPRETTLRCPITGQRHKIVDDDGAPTILDADEALDLPPGWGEIIVRRVIPHPAFAAATVLRHEHAQSLHARLAAAAADLDLPPEEQEHAVAQQVDRDLPLPPEYATVEWSFGSVSPAGMDDLDAELAKLGLVLTSPAVGADTEAGEVPEA